MGGFRRALVFSSWDWPEACHLLPAAVPASSFRDFTLTLKGALLFHSSSFVNGPESAARSVKSLKGSLEAYLCYHLDMSTSGKSQLGKAKHPPLFTDTPTTLTSLFVLPCFCPGCTVLRKASAFPAPTPRGRVESRESIWQTAQVRRVCCRTQLTAANMSK